MQMFARRISFIDSFRLNRLSAKYTQIVVQYLKKEPATHFFSRKALNYSYNLSERKLSTNINDFSEKHFHDVGDLTLEHIQDTLCCLEETIDDSEISYSQGVLSINLGAKIGTWVINKQTPNRQLWWSSPITGPRRYEYQPSDPSDKSALNCWKYSRDGSDMIDTLRSEILLSTGKKFFV